MPRLLVRASRGYLRQTYHKFSIPLLVRTIFAPWRRDSESTRGLSLPQILRVAVDNLLSRIIGAVIRTGTLVVGGAIWFAQVCIFVGIVIVWYGLPLIGIVALGYGIRLLLGGA